jgi:hypothetical protein
MVSNSLSQLEDRIEEVRTMMQNLWNERGYTDEDVLKTSVELDKLLNEYQRLYCQNSIYQK